MLFDTDVLIWVQRELDQAQRLVQKAQARLISTQTYMELLQCAHNKQEHRTILTFLKEASFEVLPLKESIGHRAAVYIEEHSLASGLRAGDALIAATAVEHGLTLCTANYKHFKNIEGLSIKRFRP